MTATQTKRQELVPIEGMRVTEGLLDTLIEISRERAEIVEAMKEALVRGDEDEALERARELMGLPRKRPTDSRS